MSDEVDGRTKRARAARQERRAQILDAALQVFSERGFHGASVSDLVAAAGVARGTFYLYFDSKNAVFLDLLEELLTGFRGSVVGVDTSEDAPPLVDQLVATVDRLLQAAAASQAVATIIFREAHVLDDEVEHRVRQFEDRLQHYVRDALDNGIAMGLLRPHDTAVVAAAVYGAIRQILYQYVVVGAHDDAGTEPRDTRVLATEVVRFSLLGVLAR